MSSRLKELLEKEKYPLRYTHKFIGDRTPEFMDAVQKLEKKFPKLHSSQHRPSSGGKHVAITWIFVAETASEILHLIQMTEALPGVRVVL